MNALFACFLILSIALFFFDPVGFLPALVCSGETAVALAIRLVGLYVFWLGAFKILESSGATKRLAALLEKPFDLLFGRTKENARELMLLNISANALGLSNLATPLGISAVKELKTGERATKTMIMFFVLNATSLQLVPTTIISLLASFGATRAESIILPTILASLATSALGVILVKVFVKE